MHIDICNSILFCYKSFLKNSNKIKTNIYYIIKNFILIKSYVTEYGTATQRLCFQRGPDDTEERCAYTVWNYKKVYMCLCYGDLCNKTTRTNVASNILIATAIYLAQWLVWRCKWHHSVMIQNKVIELSTSPSADTYKFSRESRIWISRRCVWNNVFFFYNTHIIK